MRRSSAGLDLSRRHPRLLIYEHYHLASDERAACRAHVERCDNATMEEGFDRLVDALPNGPKNHPTIRVFLAGGVPEVMLHLRGLGLIHGGAMTVLGRASDDILDEWESSERRVELRARLADMDGVDPDDVISPAERAHAKGMTSTVCFPGGNLAPGGSVIKSTAIDRRALDEDGVYRLTGRARIFTSERDAIAAIKGTVGEPIGAGDVIVLAGRGPRNRDGGDRAVDDGAQVPAVRRVRSRSSPTHASPASRQVRASATSSPEALEGGPIGRLVEGDIVRVVVDPERLEASVDLVGHGNEEFTAGEAALVLGERPRRADITADPDLPADTALWAKMQSASGGLWGGCVYDHDAIIAALDRSERAAVAGGA